MVSLLASAILASAALPIHLDVWAVGMKTGENSFSEQSDGSFRSTTDFTMAGTPVHSVLTGKISNGVLVDADLDQSVGGAATRLIYSGVDVKLTFDGKQHKMKLDKAPQAFFADYHPQLARLLVPPGGEKAPRTLKTLLLGTGQVADVTMTPLDSGTAHAGSIPVKTSVLQVELEHVTIRYVFDGSGRVLGESVQGQPFQFKMAGIDGLFPSDGSA